MVPAKFVMMKPESAYYQKIEGDSMQLFVLGFIFDVNYCVISDIQYHEQGIGAIEVRTNVLAW